MPGEAGIHLDLEIGFLKFLSENDSTLELRISARIRPISVNPMRLDPCCCCCHFFSKPPKLSDEAMTFKMRKNVRRY